MKSQLLKLLLLHAIAIFGINLLSFGQIAQRGTATFKSNTSSATTLVINKPSGVVVGDVMFASIVQAETSNNNLSNASLAGWTLISGSLIYDDGNNSGNNQWWGSLLYKVATASEPSSYTFALDADVDISIGGIVAFNGVDVTSSPFDETPGTFRLTNANDLTANAITTVSGNAVVLMFGQTANDYTYSKWGATSANGEGVFTELYDEINASGDNASIGCAWYTKSSTGSTGDRFARLSNSSRGQAIMVALKPACVNISTQPSTASKAYCLNSTLVETLSVSASALSGSIQSYKWYSNTSESNTGGTLLATHTTSSGTDSYSPSSSSTGNKYYYVEVTTSTGCSFKSNVSGLISISEMSGQNIQTFNANGSFTVPTGVTSIIVEAWGGGGSGGGTASAPSGQARGGSGGGGGAYALKTLTVTPGSTLSIVVGAAVNGTVAADGTDGNYSTVIGYESVIKAAGGLKGNKNTTGNGYAPVGGLGGSVANSKGDIVYAGNAGTAGATAYGISSGSGGNGANGGGLGGSATQIVGTTSNGVAGAPAGGGGGGSRTSQSDGDRAGGAGAAGRVIISWTSPDAFAGISGATEMYVASTTELTGTGTPHASTPWESLNPSVATITSSGRLKGETNGSVVVRYKDVAGCMSTKTINVTYPLAQYYNASISEQEAVNISTTRQVPYPAASVYTEGGIKKVRLRVKSGTYGLALTDMYSDNSGDGNTTDVPNFGDLQITNFTTTTNGSGETDIIFPLSLLVTPDNAINGIFIRTNKNSVTYTNFIRFSAGALPVTLTSFAAKAGLNNTVNLAWATSTEIVNKGFRIERQSPIGNGKFENIGFVESKAPEGGNSNVPLYYSFVDVAPASNATNYYRLAQVDLDGKTTYSDVKLVRIGGETVTMVYPNPSNGAVNISRSANTNKMNIQILDMSGRMVQQYSNVIDANFRLNINKAGMYNIKMTYPQTGEQSIQRIIVQK